MLNLPFSICETAYWRSVRQLKDDSQKRPSICLLGLQRCAFPHVVALCLSSALYSARSPFLQLERSLLGVTSVTSVISADLPSTLPLRKLDQAIADTIAVLELSSRWNLLLMQGNRP